HTRFSRDWSSDVCSSDLQPISVTCTDDPASGNLLQALTDPFSVAKDTPYLIVVDHAPTFLGSTSPIGYPLSVDGTQYFKFTFTANADFTFPAPSGSGAVGTLTTTTPASYSLTVSGAPGFSGTVTFGCTGLPANTGCTFNPSSTAPGSGSEQITLTVDRLVKSGTTIRQDVWPIPALLVLPCFFLLLPYKGPHRDFSPQKAGALVALLFVSAVTACGGGSNPSPTPTPTPSPQPSVGTYQFMVTAAASGETAKSFALTLVVK